MRKQAHPNLQSLRSLLRILQSGPEHDTETNTITTNSVDVSLAQNILPAPAPAYYQGIATLYTLNLLRTWAMDEISRAAAATTAFE